MSEQLRESVSAVMDGEADELELRRVLSEENADSVRSTWSRYHENQCVLQGSEQELRFRDWDISSKVSEAIADEKITPMKKPSRFSWGRPAASFAVAASVAFAVVVGVQSLKPVDVGSAPVVIAQQSAVSGRVYPAQSSAPQASGNMLVGANISTQANLPGAIVAGKAAADIEAQKRLEKYLLRHTESAALNNGKGMISFARIVSFETE